MDSLLRKDNLKSFEKHMDAFLSIKADSNYLYYYKGKYHLSKRELGLALDNLLKVDTVALSAPYKPWYFYCLGDVYRYLNREEDAYHLKIRSQGLFEENKDVKLTNKVNYDLHYTLISQELLEYDGSSYLQEFYKNAMEMEDDEQLFAAHLALSMLKIDPDFKEVAKHHLNIAGEYATELGTVEVFYKYQNYLSVFHQNFTRDYGLARSHADSMYYYARVLGSPNKQDSALKNMAYSSTLDGKYSDAVEYLLRADSLPITEYVFNRKRGLYKYLSKNYEHLGQIEDAFGALKKKSQFDDSVSIASQNTSLIMYETLEVEKKNLVLDQQRIRNRNLLIFSLVALALLAVLATIAISNLKKKKLLAEKEKELKTARIEKLIREQEVMSIDARYEGRERERQRIAADLHDDLGSLLSTIKLYFQNLKIRKERLREEEKKLMRKTNELLDEAYKKVRNIAHLEDAASSVSEGLVEAVTNFAIKINSIENTIVSVQNNGLDRKLDPIMERDLRRIVVELITNAIRHADASEINVEFNLIDGVLNIVVEDNGCGFDTKDADYTEGLGLKSAIKKIKAVEGEMVVESVGNNGSSIIIDIPLK
ncbi:sensor histidine kinase [Aureisphaera sp.]